MSYSFITLIFIIGTQTICNVYSEYVPVYIWEKSNNEDLEPTFSRVSQETFKEIINSRLNENIPIVVFAEKKLSPEDFIKSGNKVFTYLEKLKDSNNVTYLPQVEDPTSILTSINDIVKISVNKLSETKSLPNLKPNEILIIDLHDAKENENRPEMLERHGKKIDSVYNELTRHFDKITAIYTGYSASWITSEDIINHRLVRTILADEGIETFFKHGGFMVNLGQTITVTTKDTTTYISIIEIESSLLENNMTVTMKTNETHTTEIPEPQINLIFEVDSGYWYLNTVEHNDEIYTLRDISAPTTFSYHCSELKLEEANAKEKTILTFKEIQFQIFDNETSISQFSDAYDCVGFTTIPIWSGLFVTFILAIIMTMGLTMIMDIKTMDRFDDPKGKTIIINATE